MIDEASRQKDFPSLDAMAGMTYLNTAAEGIPPRQVIDAVVRYTEDKKLGMDGRERHEAERRAAQALCARAYGLSPEEIGICSCTSEAFNLLSSAMALEEGDEVIINDLDFPAAITPWLQPACRATVRLWRSREGALRIEDLEALIGPRTRLVTVSLVSFYNGYRLPLSQLVESVRFRSDARIAVDVTQALGRIPLHLEGADFVVSSTHKWILASHGGALVGIPRERASELTATAGGWFNIENAFEADRFERVVTKPGAASYAVGMPNYPAIYAIRAGLGYIDSIGVEAIDAYAKPLVRRVIDGLRELPIELLTPDDDKTIAGIVAFRHEKAGLIHQMLHEQNIHLMSQAGRLRVAVHGYNTQADIERFLRALNEAQKRV